MIFEGCAALIVLSRCRWSGVENVDEFGWSSIDRNKLNVDSGAKANSLIQTLVSNIHVRNRLRCPDTGNSVGERIGPRPDVLVTQP